MRRIIYGLSVLLTAALSFPVLSSQVEPYPLEAWAKRADMQNVSISPDGNRLALLKIATDEGNPILEIYDTNDLSARPFKMNADPMEMVGLDWVSEDMIVFTARAKVRNKIDGWNQGVYELSLIHI